MTTIGATKCCEDCRGVANTYCHPKGFRLRYESGDPEQLKMAEALVCRRERAL